MRIKKKILKEIDECVNFFRKKRLEEKDMDRPLYFDASLIYDVSSEHELIRSCLSTIDAKKAYDLIYQERGECQELVNELNTSTKELSEELWRIHCDESEPEKLWQVKLNDGQISAISKDQRKIGLFELQLKKKGPHLYQYYKYIKTINIKELGKLLMKSKKLGMKTIWNRPETDLREELKKLDIYP